MIWLLNLNVIEKLMPQVLGQDERIFNNTQTKKKRTRVCQKSMCRFAIQTKFKAALKMKT